MNGQKLEKLKDKKYDFYLITLLLISIVAFIVQAYFVSQIKFIGTSDPAHYAEVAENLILGKGFVMDYINEYFVKFNSITHPEEYGFPGVSLILIPSILLFGKTAFAVKLPSMIIGIILFPILTYFLGKEFFNKRIGFLAAVSILFYPAIFNLSFGGERDTMFAFFVVAGIYFFYKGTKEDSVKWFLLMGAVLGFSYLIRQVTLVIFPVLLLAYYLIKGNFSKKFLYGLGISALIMFPWLLRNYFVFGGPFYTVNKYSGQIFGFVPFYEYVWFNIYWDSGFSIFNILGLKGAATFYINRFFISLSSQLTDFIALSIFAFAGIALASKRDITKKLWRWIAFLVSFSAFAVLLFSFGKAPTIPAIYYKILIALPYIGILLTSFFFFRRGSNQNTIFILLWGAYALFFSVIWWGGGRHWLALVPFLLIYSWFAGENLLGKIAKLSREQVGKNLMIILAFLVLFSLPQTFGKFLDKNSGFPYANDARSKDMMFLSEKVNNLTEKDAVIMGCDVAVFHFYNGRKYLEFPSEDVEINLNLMKTYNVSYFTLLACDRRAIDKNFYDYLFSGRTFTENDFAQGAYDILIRLHDSSQTYKVAIPKIYLLKVFKIDIQQIPKEGFNETFRIAITDMG